MVIHSRRIATAAARNRRSRAIGRRLTVPVATAVSWCPKQSPRRTCVGGSPVITCAAAVIVHRPAPHVSAALPQQGGPGSTDADLAGRTRSRTQS